jgi:hypothetical protein
MKKNTRQLDHREICQAIVQEALRREPLAHQIPTTVTIRMDPAAGQLAATVEWEEHN